MGRDFGLGNRCSILLSYRDNLKFSMRISCLAHGGTNLNRWFCVAFCAEHPFGRCNRLRPDPGRKRKTHLARRALK